MKSKGMAIAFLLCVFVLLSAFASPPAPGAGQWIRLGSADVVVQISQIGSIQFGDTTQIRGSFGYYNITDADTIALLHKVVGQR